MKLRWVNHASFVIEAGPIRVLADPWLEGTAFDQGWKHLVPTRFGYHDFATITHIWFSHEHPDHFSPPNLRKIPVELRRRITILYQETRDGKIVEFCRKLGFREVIELRHGRWTEIAPRVRVLCKPRDDDSWLCVEADGQRLLNLNDCVIASPKEAASIAKALGPAKLDVLLTQFSYANWVGNVEDVAYRRQQAAEKLERIRHQIGALRPNVVIPFASFVWFCHEENAYMNADINTVGRAFEFIRDQTPATPLVLYPGDAWEVGADHDSSRALKAYEDDLSRVFKSELIRSEPVPLATLQAQAKSYYEKLRTFNGQRVFALVERAGFWEDARVWLTDFQGAYTLSTRTGLKASSFAREEADVILSSAALSYCLREMWGENTLEVNGRYQIGPRGSFARFKKHFYVAEVNNHGRTILSMVPSKIRSALGF